MRLAAPNKKGFTLIELLVVIAIIALLMAIIMPALRKVKDQAKITVCLSNTKQLTTAWLLYIDDNDGKMVDAHNWTPSIYEIGSYVMKPESVQLDEIQTGPLFRYLGDSTKIFRCPTQRKEVKRSYNITHAMNGGPFGDTAAPRFTKLAQIKNTNGRFVFVDEYNVTWGPWTQWYSEAVWWNQPLVQHNNGGTYSFADGHSEYLKMREERTLELGKMSFEDYTNAYGFRGPAPDSDELAWVRRSMWGKIRN